MGVVERSSANVESCLAALEESYSTFSVNQTSIEVSPSQYAQARAEAREDRVDLYAKVRNDDGEVLHVRKQDAVALPSTTTPVDRSLELAVCEAVADRTGVECSVTAVDRATIVGISNAEDVASGTIYRLAVLFEAAHDAGRGNDDVVWQQTATPPQPIVG
ncbi:hypothetical protein BRD08_05250 [Halobacteriales archaeon SW_10_66_29]|nr:MAG: hypothetical protein BRC66_07685 [Halobacteriales archaeon QH_2_66_30]PSQ36244.1 MAG: hypothetical protein BRD08_05250 [Halobacteriales archaeon SW_10_66_29]